MSFGKGGTDATGQRLTDPSRGMLSTRDHEERIRSWVVWQSNTHDPAMFM